MPWQRRWPPYVPQRVADDRRKALEDLEQSSGDLREAAEHAVRSRRIAADLRTARERNHFSESMESLFAAHAQARTNGKETR